MHHAKHFPPNCFNEGSIQEKLIHLLVIQLQLTPLRCYLAQASSIQKEKIFLLSFLRFLCKQVVLQTAGGLPSPPLMFDSSSEWALFNQLDSPRGWKAYHPVMERGEPQSKHWIFSQLKPNPFLSPHKIKWKLQRLQAIPHSSWPFQFKRNKSVRQGTWLLEAHLVWGRDHCEDYINRSW